MPENEAIGCARASQDNTTPDWLSYHAAVTPSRPALLARDQVWTWAELHLWTDAVAAGLRRLGVRADDRVGVLLGNIPEFVVLVHALMRLRAVLVPLNLRLAAAELQWQVEDADLRLLVHDASTAKSARDAAGPSNVPLAPATDLAAEPLGDGPILSEAGNIDLAAVQGIVYTSGTTGRPKGALLTYRAHWWSAFGSAVNLGNHRDDRWLAVLPMYHVGGLAIVMRGAIHGTSVVVQDSFDAANVNAAIENQGVTLVSVVSRMLEAMLEERCGRPYPESLRHILLGGGPATPALLESCARLAVMRRRGLVLTTYGMTETASQAATLAPEDAPARLASAGKPLMGLELLVEQDRDGTPLAADRAEGVGEILVRGPTVSPGYWRYDASTARTPDGWFRTGDIGYLDDEGYLCVLDRRYDLIVSGGENVYPAEVEAALLLHPDVEEAGVTGAPDERWGQTVVASVRLRPGATATADDLRAHCGLRLAKYKTPSRIELVAELPRTASGKLLRRVLRDHHANRDAER